MTDYIVSNGLTQVSIPLKIKPHTHKAIPTITGSVFSEEAGTVLYGFYNMEYLLPDGDKLQLIANHNKKTVQLMLFTHHPELLQTLPGPRATSLVADSINRVHRYRIRSQSYLQPLTTAQQSKLQLCNDCIDKLSQLLSKEQHVNPQDYQQQISLKKEVAAIIEEAQDRNRQLANNPAVSEGELGAILYDTYKAALHFKYNRIHAVSPQDQLDFSDVTTQNFKDYPCFIWDSEIHIGHESRDLDDALRAICQFYQLTPARALGEVPANRFEKLEAFFIQLWQDGRDWIDHLAQTTKPTHSLDIQRRDDGLSISNVTPYYQIQGMTQKAYPNLQALVMQITQNARSGRLAKNYREAKNELAHCENGHWRIIANEAKLLVKVDDKLVALKYFVHEEQFYPLPDGQDLYDLSQISKRHLYLPERVQLKLRAFASRIPSFFSNFYHRLIHFFAHDLHADFVNHIHAGHEQEVSPAEPVEPDPINQQIKNSLREALANKGLLSNGQTLEQFVQTHLNNSPYVIARANHPPSPPAYDNPFHRVLSVLRHVASVFIDTSERSPIIGSLAAAAYLYGGGAVLAPEALESVLTKLHLHGLITGIEPVQKLGQWMSHGRIPEAISASATMWQGVIAGGNIDKFFVNAVSVLKDDPAEIAIIVSLALSFGCGITKVFPSLQNEMGEFPLPNYAALGGKSGAAVYDTIMHPGDDWLLGTFKWIAKGFMTLAKLTVAPFVEAYFYGFAGFINGWRKTGTLFLHLAKQILVACLDFTLSILTLPVVEVSSLLIHVPFRGVTNLLNQILATLGNFSALGQALNQFATRPSTSDFLSDFRWSPLYGFSSPFDQYSQYPVLNYLLNALALITFPPLQIIKNCLVLPLIDSLSLVVRLHFTVLNPLSRLSAYALGTIISGCAEVWDGTIGLLFSYTATSLTTVWNWLDHCLGNFKQELLGVVEILRAELYHWAFSEEDLRIHPTLTDQEYFSSNPIRYEKTPHEDSPCLLQTLLKAKDDNTSKLQVHVDEHYSALFSEQTESPSDTNTHLCQLLP